MQGVADDSVLPPAATLPRLARICAVVVAVVSVVVLIGWAVGIRLMTSGLPDLTTMKVNTALCLGALAVTLLVGSAPVIRLGSAFVIVMTLLTLVEIITGADLRIDEILVSDHTVKHGINPGQMAPATAVSLLVLAASRLLLDRGRSQAAERLLAVPMLTATMTLFGYLFGVEQLYRVTTLSSVAIHSAVCWALLTVAVASLVPNGVLPWIASGTGPGSAVVRGTVPVVTGGLIGLGLLRDALTDAGAIGDRFGTAVMAVAGSLLGVAATVRTARPFDAAHQARLRAEKSLRDLNDSLVEGRDAAWTRAENLAAELERERSRFERAVGNTEDLVWTVETTEGTLRPTYFSPNAGRILGGPIPSGLASLDELVPLVDPADRVGIERFRSDVLSGIASELEHRVRGLDGRVRWIWLRGSPRIEGERTFFDGIATNITERRALADQRELMLEQARLQVQRLSELAQARQEFTTVAGHELRTPVAVIVGYCEMLADPAVAPEVRDQAIEAISRRAAQLRDLVDDVFDLAKLDAGALQLQLEPVEIAEFLGAAVTDYLPVARAAGVDLLLSVEADGAVEAVADRGRLRQAVDNLLSNAIKYTQVGGHAEVVLGRRGDVVLLEVRDDGIGVADDELPRLFERMFRGTNALEARIPGTGLGLALTKELVEEFGGVVSARANVPHGLVVRLELPALEGAAPPLAVQSQRG